RLGPRALGTLLETEKSSNIIVQFLAEQLGLDDSSKGASVLSSEKPNSVPGQKALARLGTVIDVDPTGLMGKSFRFQKRIVDVLGAALLIIMLSPVIIIVASVVALDVGFPLIFWQQRPGLYGRPFKLYKFRTMQAPHDRHRRRIPDDQRSSP